MNANPDPLGATRLRVLNAVRELMIRIISANLARVADAVLFAKLAHSLGADAVAVQELATRQAQELASKFPFGRLEVSPHRMGIALARPAVVHEIPLAARSAYAVEVADSADEQITIVNVHIIAPHAAAPWKIASLRRRQVRDLDAYLGSAPRPLVLVGDLNSTALWPAYRRLTRTLTDAVADAARLKPNLEEVALEQGDILFQAEEPITHVLFPHEGVVSLQVLGADGHLQAVDPDSNAMFDVISGQRVRPVDDKVMPFLKAEDTDMEVFPVVQNFDGTDFIPAIGDFLNNPTARAKFRTEISLFLASDHYRGLMIDFESFPKNAQPAPDAV